MKTIKNLFLYSILFLAKLFGLTKSKKAKANHILIVSTTGFGDTLWATPSIASIKASHPKSHLGILTSKLGSDILKNSPHIDSLYVLKSSLFSLIRLLLTLRRKKYHTVLVFHSSQRIILPLVSLIGAKEIIGTKGINKGFDKLLTKAFEKQENVHEIKRRLDLSNSLGLSKQLSQMQVYPSHLNQEKASSFLPKKIQGPIIAFHPGAKDVFKTWDINSFIELGKLIEKTFKAHLYITGTKDEESLCQKICDKLPNAYNLCSKLSSLELASFLSKLDLLITSDTGPMHLAFATNTKTVALFSPTNPKLCGPYEKDQVKIIQKDKTCTPCKRKKCSMAFCMLQISPNEVFESIQSLLQTNIGSIK